MSEFTRRTSGKLPHDVKLCPWIQTLTAFYKTKTFKTRAEVVSGIAKCILAADTCTCKTDLESLDSYVQPMKQRLRMIVEKNGLTEEESTPLRLACTKGASINEELRKLHEI